MTSSVLLRRADIEGVNVEFRLEVERYRHANGESFRGLVSRPANYPVHTEVAEFPEFVDVDLELIDLPACHEAVCTGYCQMLCDTRQMLRLSGKRGLVLTAIYVNPKRYGAEMSASERTAFAGLGHAALCALLGVVLGQTPSLVASETPIVLLASGELRSATKDRRVADWSTRPLQELEWEIRRRAGSCEAKGIIERARSEAKLLRRKETEVVAEYLVSMEDNLRLARHYETFGFANLYQDRSLRVAMGASVQQVLRECVSVIVHSP